MKQYKYRIFWKPERKPYGFIQGVIYTIESIDGEACTFKGSRAVHLFSDFERVEEVE